MLGLTLLTPGVLHFPWLKILGVFMEISVVGLGIDQWQEYLKSLFRAEGGCDWGFCGGCVMGLFKTEGRVCCDVLPGSSLALQEPFQQQL